MTTKKYFCEKCGIEVQNTGGQCVCGNWLYYHMVKKEEIQ